MPKYVALPRQWERGHGRRNLVGGVILLVLAVLFSGWALYLAGPAAIFTVAACLATATLLHVMARSRLFRQRNGAFVAWAGVCLLGVVLVIVHQGWVYMTGGSQAGPRKNTASAEAPLLQEAFPTKAELAGGVVRILKDTKVNVEGRTYLVKVGELYPLVDVGVDERGNGQLRFSAGGHDVVIAKSAAEIAPSEGVPGLDATPDRTAAAAPTATPAPAIATAPAAAKELTFQEKFAASQQAAMRRYPALARVGSPENRLFLTASREARAGQEELLKDPNWPLILADYCADKEGWPRSDGSEPPLPPEPSRPETEPVAPPADAPKAPAIPRGVPVRRPPN